ncbi:hypothetical protein GCM10011608_14400 [Micromonospora sonchi]|uniref:Gas vesicle protein n=1 Tax=Micromonospora sonchi TaxID=1763543 RepID=A0A917TPZ7_9ACTN|nr:gas vesicle protein [Micromonospora sonchi]GGM30945.1 hypothetical protein GCM10011608_14400 [Micromonospora sonchi]
MDLLDRVLATGVVISGDITISIAEVDLVRISLRALVASVGALAPPVPDAVGGPALSTSEAAGGSAVPTAEAAGGSAVPILDVPWDDPGVDPGQGPG